MRIPRRFRNNYTAPTSVTSERPSRDEKFPCAILRPDLSILTKHHNLHALKEPFTSSRNENLPGFGRVSSLMEVVFLSQEIPLKAGQAHISN